MLGTMKDLEKHQKLLDELDATGELPSIPEDDYLDPDRASELVAHQLDTQKFIKHCKSEIDKSLEAASRALREQDLVGWLAEELRREHLQGYLSGLEHLDSIINNLVEATPVRPSVLMNDVSSRERYRQHAVDRIARINDGLLRRQERKDKSGIEN